MKGWDSRDEARGGRGVCWIERLKIRAMAVLDVAEDSHVITTLCLFPVPISLLGL